MRLKITVMTDDITYGTHMREFVANVINIDNIPNLMTKLMSGFKYKNNSRISYINKIEEIIPKIVDGRLVEEAKLIKKFKEEESIDFLEHPEKFLDLDY